MQPAEWAKAYPEIAAEIYGCKVEELDAVIAQREKEQMERERRSDPQERYYTMAEINQLLEGTKKVIDGDP